VNGSSTAEELLMSGEAKRPGLRGTWSNEFPVPRTLGTQRRDG